MTTRTSWPARGPSDSRSSSSARRCARGASRWAAAAWPPGWRWRSRTSTRRSAWSASRPRPWRPTRPRWPRGTPCRSGPNRPWPTASRSAGREFPVSEEIRSRGLLLCLERAKQVVEPAGAAGVAALLEHARDFAPPVVVVLSGGNIDPLLLAKLLRHGLTAAGRYLAFRCRLSDRPRSLAKLLGDLADLGANVLEVGHERLAPRLHVDEVEVVVQVETRGPEHCAEVIGALRAAGYSLAFA